MQDVWECRDEQYCGGYDSYICDDHDNGILMEEEE